MTEIFGSFRKRNENLFSIKKDQILYISIKYNLQLKLTVND